MWIFIISIGLFKRFLVTAFTYLSKISSLYLCKSIENQLAFVFCNLDILLLIPGVITSIVGFFQMFYIDSYVIWNKDILFLVFQSVVPFMFVS